MPNLGTTELIIILAIVLLIFGAGKLPEVFRAMGSGVREFRDASHGSDKKEEAKSDKPAAE